MRLHTFILLVFLSFTNGIMAQKKYGKIIFLNKSHVLGKVVFKNNSNFTKVSFKHTRKTMYLRKEVYASFQEMHHQAARDGVHIFIISGARDFEHQKNIWNRKWEKAVSTLDIDKAYELLNYSAMPGTSRHHWGTDIDLNSLSNTYFLKKEGKKVFDWLCDNASKYGFYQVYTSKKTSYRTGYNEEKWHWSYLPSAKQYLSYFNTYITNKDLVGFKGAELAEALEIVKLYVNGGYQEVGAVFQNRYVPSSFKY